MVGHSSRSKWSREGLRGQVLSGEFPLERLESQPVGLLPVSSVSVFGELIHCRNQSRKVAKYGSSKETISTISEP